MQRYKQHADEILGELSRLETSWQDEHSSRIIGYLVSLGGDVKVVRRAIQDLLMKDFDCAIDIIRLLLDLSADEFRAVRREAFGAGKTGKKQFADDPDGYLAVLDRLGLEDAISRAVDRKLHWSDVLVERLKAGRGSAIKGQRRGRQLETEVEAVVRSVFGPDGYCMRCRFVGRDGKKTEKTDVAIPTPEDPRILIEVKGFGATGSKQTDVIGDVKRILAEKRTDTTLLLVLDGLTWRERENDLRNLVMLQREGDIARIYTTKMFSNLKSDLEDLRRDHHLAATTELPRRHSE
ncbi:DpnII family type II restriction endonuclease [Verrucomicrobiota bacterium sgz303538]